MRTSNAPAGALRVAALHTLSHLVTAECLSVSGRALRLCLLLFFATLWIGDGWSVAATQSSQRAYVSNRCNNTVSVIDTATNTVIDIIPTGNSPQGIAITPDGTRVYVTNLSSNSVSVIDTTTNTVPATVPVGVGPLVIAITPDGTRAYVTNGSDGTVSVINTVTNTVAATVIVGINPVGIAITPDGARAYVMNFESDTVSVIDTDPMSPTYNTVVTTVMVDDGPLAMAITPDRTRAYVSNFNSDSVSVIDTDPMSPTYYQVLDNVTVGDGAEGIAITPDGTRAYVTNENSDSVSVIDTDPMSPTYNTVVTTIIVDNRPLVIAITPDGTRAYVTNLSSDSVSVIDTDTMSATYNTVVATVSDVFCPVWVAISGSETTLNPDSLPNGQAGIPYSQALEATPPGIYFYSLLTGMLPPGISLNPTTGLISGLTRITGTYDFTIRAQNQDGLTITKPYTLVIECPTIMLNLESLPDGVVGKSYSATLSAEPVTGTYTYSVPPGSLPPGLSLNATTGKIAGSPTKNGEFNFTITVTGFGSCSKSQPYKIIIGGIGCPTVTLPPSPLPSGTVGKVYSRSLAASPAGAYTYSVGEGLPPGLTLYGANGLLYGYPTLAGSYDFTITATGSGGCSGTMGYILTIGAK